MCGRRGGKKKAGHGVSLCVCRGDREREGRRERLREGGMEGRAREAFSLPLCAHHVSFPRAQLQD